MAIVSFQVNLPEGPQHFFSPVPSDQSLEDHVTFWTDLLSREEEVERLKAQLKQSWGPQGASIGSMGSQDLLVLCLEIRFFNRRGHLTRGLVVGISKAGGLRVGGWEIRSETLLGSMNYRLFQQSKVRQPLPKPL